MNILRMIPPDDFPSTSSLDGKVRITGNVKLALEIKKSAKKIIANGKNLYLAQEEIKNVLIKDYGAEWFKKNGEAVNFIIENEYARYERKLVPFPECIEDVERNVLY